MKLLFEEYVILCIIVYWARRTGSPTARRAGAGRRDSRPECGPSKELLMCLRGKPDVKVMAVRERMERSNSSVLVLTALEDITGDTQSWQPPSYSVSPGPASMSAPEPVCPSPPPPQPAAHPHSVRSLAQSCVCIVLPPHSQLNTRLTSAVSCLTHCPLSIF